MINRIQDVTYEQVDSYLKFTKERGKYSYVSDDRTVKLNYPDMRKDLVIQYLIQQLITILGI